MESLSLMLMTSDIVSTFIKYDPHEFVFLLLIHGGCPRLMVLRVPR